ncbi:MAG TPA: hypothetical protein VGQ26_26265 [Streptosporangiaceae bacterium]|nr:hypothetical protein [Streptosporangiaceae bacterium]
MNRGELSGAGRAASLRHPLSKVPEVTVYFWITKVLTTGMGEATSDYLVHRVNPKIAVVIGFTAFAAAMALQFRSRRYNTWVYWLAASWSPFSARWRPTSCTLGWASRTLCRRCSS